MNKILLVAAVLLLGTCRFHLKGISGISHPFPYQTWYIANGQAMQQALDKAPRYADGKLVGTGKARVVLTVNHIDIRKDVYTIIRTAKINEYLLILYIEAQTSVSGESLGEPTTVVVNHRMDYTDSDVSDKAGEKQTIWSGMCTDIAEQIMCRLTFLKVPQ